MRSAIGNVASPNMPMPNVVAQTIVKATINAAAAAKTGLQRAASHSSSGKNAAMGTTAAQDCRGKKIMTPHRKLSAPSATAPSITSLRGGGSRATETSPINSGATVTMPSASDANQ